MSLRKSYQLSSVKINLMFWDFELSEEQKMIVEAIREFAVKELTPERMREYEEKESFPWDIYRKVCQQGFQTLHFPEEYGGQGYGLLEHFIYVYEITKVDPPVGDTLCGAHFGVELLLDFGTHEQKAKWLPSLAKGEITIAAMFTEPAGGSDLTRVLDTKALKVDHETWKINGTKTFVTNGETFRVANVLAQTDPNARPPYKGQTIFLLERKEGIETMPLHGKMGWRSSPTSEVTFTDVTAKDNDILGGLANLGRGFYMTIAFLPTARAKIGCMGVAAAEAALERAEKYAKEREAFGRKIGSFQGLAHRLSEAALKVELGKSLLFRAIKILEKARVNKAYAEEATKFSSMLKYYGASLAVEVCDLAIDVFGGYGYMADYDIERWFRWSKKLELVEGTKEIQKNAIAKCLLGKNLVEKF